MAKILWKDIKIGDEFMDGSKVVSIHDSYEAECYRIFYKENNLIKNFLNINRDCVLSETHLLLCDISNLNEECKNWVINNFSDYQIPTLIDKHVYLDSNDSIKLEKDEVIESDLSKVSEFEYWLPLKAIFLLIKTFKQKLYCNKNLLIDVNHVGIKKVFCVETDSHKFETCGLIHHNSVTLRNIIFHCLTHGEQISIALIDLKWTEFTPFKGMKNVVAVANTVQEAVEVMRIAREVMYKRNQEMAKLGINDIKDYKPKKPTNEVVVAGRKLKDDQEIEIKTINGEIKTVTVKELEQYL